MPEATGKFLVNTMRAPRFTPGALGQQPRRLHDKIVGAGVEAACKWPGDRHRQTVRRCKDQCVADSGKHHQTFQRVITVGALVADMQKQIDLGRGGNDQPIRICWHR